MTQRTNELNQPIGDALPNWEAALFPKTDKMEGSFCDVELLDKDKHVKDLFEAFQHDKESKTWTYMGCGPFTYYAEFENWVEVNSDLYDQVYYAIVEKKTGKAIGFASYMRIQEAVGVIEVGSIAYSPLLQRTPVATEAMYLMMKQAFEVFGYRRYEWKCDSLNAASRRAAERYGFTYEGLFRQALVYRGRNRDTAWYSILDHEWSALKSAYQSWLSPNNFDDDGQQKEKLSSLISKMREGK